MTERYLYDREVFCYTLIRFQGVRATEDRT